MARNTVCQQNHTNRVIVKNQHTIEMLSFSSRAFLSLDLTHVAMECCVNIVIENAATTKFNAK